jgi:hypothetical protein
MGGENCSDPSLVLQTGELLWSMWSLVICSQKVVIKWSESGQKVVFLNLNFGICLVLGIWNLEPGTRGHKVVRT